MGPNQRKERFLQWWCLESGKPSWKKEQIMNIQKFQKKGIVFQSRRGRRGKGPEMADQSVTLRNCDYLLWLEHNRGKEKT